MLRCFVFFYSEKFWDYNEQNEEDNSAYGLGARQDEDNVYLKIYVHSCESVIQTYVKQ